MKSTNHDSYKKQQTPYVNWPPLPLDFALLSEGNQKVRWSSRLPECRNMKRFEGGSMKSTNQDIYKRQQLAEPWQRKIFRKRLRWFATVMASIALCAAAATPLAAQKSKTPPRFVDNGDGTVTDSKTGLMWEKKTDSNVNDTYFWSSSGSAPDGPLFTSFLATMRCDISADGSCGLAGHYDWRVPNSAELQTIRDCSQPSCIDPIFGPTVAFSYWSASTDAQSTANAWAVCFGNGCGSTLFNNAKVDTAGCVRVVRGGR